jgi:hypothetical protein
VVKIVPDLFMYFAAQRVVSHSPFGAPQPSLPGDQPGLTVILETDGSITIVGKAGAAHVNEL